METKRTRLFPVDYQLFWDTALVEREIITTDLAWTISDEKQLDYDNRSLRIQKADYEAELEHAREHGQDTLASHWTVVDKALKEWCIYGSWGRCRTCSVLIPLKLNQRALDHSDLAPIDRTCGLCCKWIYCGCYQGDCAQH